MRRWCWGSVARSYGTGTTSTTRFRPRSWCWCARRVGSALAIRSLPGSAASLIERPIGESRRRSASLRRCREARGVCRTGSGRRDSSSICGPCSTRNWIDSRTSSGARSCSAISRVSRTRKRRDCCAGRSVRSAAGSRAGRQLLRSRLERRGVTASSAIFGANWLAGTPTSMALPLLESTVNAAIGCAASRAVSTAVLTLTQGVLRIMLLRKLRTISVAVLLFSTVSGSSPCGHTGHRQQRRPVVRYETAVQTGDRRPTSTSSQPVGADARIADCPSDDCPASAIGQFPTYCPISLATNAFSKMIDHFHHAVEPSLIGLASSSEEPPGLNGPRSRDR